MKIAIVGCGAMGSVYATLFTEAGFEVHAIDQWQEHVDTINRDGLRLEGATGDRVVRLHATTDPAEVGVSDLVIVSTKARDVAAAAKSLGPLVGPDTLIGTFQNGLGAAERIAAAMETDNVLIGVVGGFGASMKGPGHAHHNGWEMVRLGEMGGGHTDRLDRFVKAWRDAGFKADGYEDIDRMVWEKFCCNVTFSGTCTLTNMTVGEVMANEDAWALARACAREAYAVGLKKGVKFSFDDIEAYITAFGQKIPGSLPSMQQDHAAKRPSEIDAINGAVPRVAAELGLDPGVATPVNQAVSRIIRAREATFL